MNRKYILFYGFILMILAGAFFPCPIYTQSYDYIDSWGPEGFSLESQSSSSVEINYSIHSYLLSQSEINGRSQDVLSLPGTLLPGNEGAPNLPGTGRFIAIPRGSTAHYEIVSYRTETYRDIDIAPSPRIPWETDDSPLEYARDKSIYSKDEYYPRSPVLLSEVTQIRGVDVVTLGITPFQYNPVSKELLVYRDMKVRISFTGGTGHIGEDRLRSRWWDPLMEDMFLNSASLPKVNYNNSSLAKDDIGCDYLIITPTNEEFLQWADSIRSFRTQQGIHTQVMTVEEAGGNDVNTLEAFFDEVYYEWDLVPSAVLILGDYGINSEDRILSPIWDSYCASDNIWADVTGNDMPDFIFARMTAQDGEDLEVMVSKFLDYERTPPTGEAFYDHPITALGFQTSRWFQICSETVAGFWENELGKNPVRINAIYNENDDPTIDPWSTAPNTTTVLDIFGPDGLGYLPSLPGDVACSWNGTAQDVVDAINAGSFMLQHRDHGSEYQWGEPEFYSSDIDNLTNTELPFIWSVNCLTGKYNMPGECFAEKFHRYTYNGENSGALGLNAASETSYSFVNDAYAWGAYDNMWPDFLPDYGSTPEERGILPAFGMVAGKYFLEQSSWPYNIEAKLVTYHLFHHHGDAFNTIYSEVPMELTIEHSPILFAEVPSFDITANEGALIALTVNGELIGTAEGTGTPVTILIPGQQLPNKMLVTVTKQNYLRYEQYVEIVLPNGAYVIPQAIVLNDTAGNGNGIMETAEAILATITLENVGNQNTDDVTVTLSTEDEYVIITDSTETYGSIESGAQSVVEDGFAWDVSGSIPDLHDVLFQVESTDGELTWTTNFVIQSHAPTLEIGQMTINDDNGNGNGRLEAGEEAKIYFETENSGSFLAANATGKLTVESAFITIENNTYGFDDLEAGQSDVAVFVISASEDAPLGVSVDFIYEISSGEYAVSESFNTSIGLIVEDWETGDMANYDWSTGGNGNWFVSTAEPYEGAYCIQSSDIDNNQSTWLEMEFEVIEEDNIAFAYRVSSEASYDFLRFYIDDNLEESWSGEKGWTTVEFPVPEGMHTFKWTYEKDYSVSSGSDCGWIDFIVLPSPAITTAYAGQDAVVCANSPFTVQGAATYYNQLSWTTSGTGTFENAGSLSTIYSPGAEDIELGEVVLSLTAYSPDVEISDDMLLTIPAAPEAYAGLDIQSCSNVPFALNEATAFNHTSVSWTTTGDGSFSYPETLNPVYLPGAEDVANGSVTLVLTASGSNACDDATDNIEVEILQSATAFAGNDAEICSNDNYAFNEAEADGYTALLWTTSGDGSFDDETSLNPVYFPGLEEAANGFAEITLQASGSEGCDDAISSLNLSIMQAPLAYAGADDAVLQDESYILNNAVAIHYTELLWTTSGDGSFDDPASMNPIYTPGAADTELKEVTLTFTAWGEDPCEAMTDEMMLSVNTSVDEYLAGFDINIYPNPNNGNFTLELKGPHNEMITIRIFDAIGNEVYRNEKVEVNRSYIENLSLEVKQGIYYVRLEGEKLLVNRKILIQK